MVLRCDNRGHGGEKKLRATLCYIHGIIGGKDVVTFKGTRKSYWGLSLMIAVDHVVSESAYAAELSRLG
jgi:hypothetical protein